MAYERKNPYTPVMDLPAFAKKFYDGPGKTLVGDEFRERFTKELTALMTNSYVNANVIFFTTEEKRAEVRKDLVKVFESIAPEMKKVVSLVASGKPADYFKLWEAFDTTAFARIGRYNGHEQPQSQSRNSVRGWW